MNPTDAERALLGAVLSGYPTDTLTITADDFYQPAHAAIFDACTRLAAQGLKPDPTLAATRLDGIRLPTETRLYLADLYAFCPITANAPHYAHIVTRAADLRRIQEAAQRITTLTGQPDADPADIASQAHTLFTLTGRDLDDPVTVDQVMPDVIDQIQHGQTTGQPTPWIDLNQKIHGLVPGRLYIIGGRPASGKSILAQNCATHVATTQGVFYASLEMTRDDLTMRFLADAAHVDISKMQSRQLDEREWARIRDVPQTVLDAHRRIVIDDSAGQTLATITRRARDVKRTRGLGLICVDYLQLMRSLEPKGANRETIVAGFSRGLKQLAKELEVPIIALAQLNREVEKRESGKPTMADLRESGGIEADADVILLIQRGKDLDDWQMTLHLEKNRHGPKGHIDLHLWGHYSQALNAA